MTSALLITALTLSAPALKERPASTSLVGEWVAEECTVAGKPSNFQDGDVRWVFAADGTRSILKGGQRAVTGKWAIDATKTPLNLDLDSDGPRGASYLCIYKIEGDTLTLNVGWQSSPRPEAFVSPEGSKSTLYVFKRVKAKD